MSAESIHRAGIPALLAEGLAHHREGRVAKAEACYRQVLEVEPNQPEALRLLGLLAHQAGRTELALAILNDAVKAAPGDLLALNTFAGVLIDAGRFDAALDILRHAEKLEPGFAPTHLGLGQLHRRQGRLDDAETAFRKAAELAPADAGAELSLGLLLGERGDSAGAAAAFERILTRDPQQPEALSNLGSLRFESGEGEAAIALFRRALDARPRMAPAAFNLGRALQALGRFEEAEVAYRKAAELDPSSAEVHNNLGNVLHGMNRSAEAVTTLGRAAAIEPERPQIHYNLGLALQRQGRDPEAEAAFLRAIELDPASVDAHCAYAEVHRFKPADLEIGSLRRLVANGDLPAEDRNRLRFALGRALEDIKSFDDAFATVKRANEEIGAGAAFDRVQHSLLVRQVEEAFAEPVATASGGVRPVFVIGLPLSGADLTGALVAEHAEIGGEIETGFVPLLVSEALKVRGRRAVLPAGLIGADTALAAEVGLRLRQEQARRAAGKKSIVVALPDSHFYVGLLATACPEAIFVAVERDLRDVAVELYFRYFAAGHDYAYEPAAIAAYLAGHKRLMLHWRRLLGDRIVTVDHDLLVRQPTAALAAVFARLGLDAPASFRRSVSDEDVGRWRKYLAHLGELHRALTGD